MNPGSHIGKANASEVSYVSGPVYITLKINTFFVVVLSHGDVKISPRRRTSCFEHCIGRLGNLEVKYSLANEAFYLGSSIKQGLLDTHLFPLRIFF